MCLPCTTTPCSASAASVHSYIIAAVVDMFVALEKWWKNRADVVSVSIVFHLAFHTKSSSQSQIEECTAQDRVDTGLLTVCLLYLWSGIFELPNTSPSLIDERRIKLFVGNDNNVSSIKIAFRILYLPSLTRSKNGHCWRVRDPALSSVCYHRGRRRDVNGLAWK